MDKKKKVIIIVGVLAVLWVLGTIIERNEKITADNKSSVKTEIQVAENINSAKVLIDIKGLIGKNESDIDKILGNPEKTEEGKWRYSGTEKWIDNCPTKFYKNNTIEIKFVEGIAARITFTPVEKIPFDNLILEKIGLKNIDPSEENQISKTWNNIEGIYSVQIFSNESNVNYIYVISEEKFK